MSLINLTPSQLRQAADLKEKIEALQHQLDQIYGAPSGDASAAASNSRAKRKISAAGIAKIRAAQKKRWARVKGLMAAPAKRGPKKMSAEARAKIAAAAKARWAKVRAAGSGKK